MRKYFKADPASAGSVIILVGLIASPLFLVFLYSVHPNGELDLLYPLRALLSPALRNAFLHSVMLGISVVICSTVIAAPIAFLMSKTTFQSHKWLDVIFLIPFMTPPYISSMGWMMFMQKRGFLEQLCPVLSVLTNVFFSYGGMVLIMSLHIFPFIYLMMKNTLSAVGSQLEEAATIFGASGFYRMKKIVLPLVFSGYSMGALLVFIKTISEFGTPATMGRKIGYAVLTTEIHRYVSTWPISFEKATALSSLLLGTCLIIWYIQSAFARKRQYKLIGGKGQKVQLKPVRGIWAVMSWGYLILLLMMAIGVPYFSVIATSLMKLRGYGLAYGNFTLAHYAAIFEAGSAGRKALVNSLVTGFAAATIAMCLGTWLAMLTVMYSKNKNVSRLIDMMSLLPNTVPAIVLTIGLMLFWNASWMPLRIYNTPWIVILTYVVLFLPYTVQYVKADLIQIDASLLHAGKVFGGRPFYVFRRILLPLMLPGMLSGWMMTFTISVRELVASLMILPPNMKTTATYIFSEFEQGDISNGMAMAVVSVGVTTLVLIIINQFKQVKE
ncbi:MAG: iron(III) transport system permease protein [Clostridiales bacterium]|nr:iron(III) transport system permease protein [Clostridiales bacterium]